MSLSVKSTMIDAFGNEDASKNLWLFIYCLWVGSIILEPYGWWGVFHWPLSYWWLDISMIILGILMPVRALIMYEKYEVNITASPAHVALLKIWGVLLPVLFRASTVMSHPGFPFKLEYQLIATTPTPIILPLDKVTCIASTAQAGDAPKGTSAGGTVEVRVVAFVEPNTDDARETIIFVQRGGIVIITAAITSRIERVVRHIAALYDWESFQFKKSELTVMLLVEIAKIDFHELLRGPDGLILDSEFDLSLNDYQNSRPKIRNVVKYLFPEVAGGEAVTDPIEKERVTQEIDIFLKLTKEPCFWDEMGLGFKIRQLDVTHITGSAALQAEGDLAAAEKIQRERDLQDGNTNAARAMVYVNASGGQMKFSEALDQVLAEKGAINAITIRGSGNSVDNLAAVLGTK